MQGNITLILNNTTIHLSAIIIINCEEIREIESEVGSYSDMLLFQKFMSFKNYVNVNAKPGTCRKYRIVVT